MLKVGIAGLGFMGKMHFGVYAGSKKAKVAAISDVDPKKLKGDWSAIGGNIDDAGGKKADLAGVSTYKKPEDLIMNPEIDIVDITLPTFMHAKYACMALEQGKHVFCEKPIALNLREAKMMLSAARKSKGMLMIGHCIRFWPEYELLKKYIDGKKYGKVYSASFGRFSPTPVWGWKNWLQTGSKSGGAALDLHIHDTDVINWLFGMPLEVCSAGVSKTSGAVDNISTLYRYKNRMQVSAEGGWAYHPAFPFEMNFRVVFEKATVEYSSAKNPSLSVYTVSGKTLHPEVKAGDGYAREIDYFLDCVKKNRKLETVTPEDAVNSLKIVSAEIESVKKKKPVRIKK